MIRIALAAIGIPLWLIAVAPALIDERHKPAGSWNDLDSWTTAWTGSHVRECARD
jgi:uncharacterized membrane protein YozB (DUF420 family)